jgi:hypothetical protein
MFLVDQHVSVSSLPSCHINDGLVGLPHWYVVIPCPHTLFRKKFQHLLNLSRRAYQATCQAAALEDQGKHCHFSVSALATGQSYLGEDLRLTVKARNFIFRGANLNKLAFQTQ